MFRPRHQRNFFNLVPAIWHGWRAFVKLTLMMECFLVEAFQQKLELLFKEITIGVRIEEGRSKGLHLAR